MAASVSGGTQIDFIMSSYSAGTPSAKVRPQKPGPQIVTFALQKRPRATRASVPKVRTGCMTCKKRHVKCDEAKPSCQRCLKWQGFCEGYETPSPSVASSPAPSEPASAQIKKRAPAPRTTSDPVRRQIDDSTPLTTTLLSTNPSDQMFDNDMELRYFTIWYAARARMGGGFFEDEMWEQTIPQLSHHHSSIRYAAMAVGAMSQSVRRGFMPQTAAELAAYGADYRLALSYYGKAMGTLRSADVDSDSLRAAVVCCLLFICFEALHGDSKAAFSHFNNAQIMLDEMLQRVSGDSDANPFGSEALERDILNTFQRFMLQSWSCGVLRPRFQDKKSTLPAGQLFPSLPWCCRGGLTKQRRVEEMPPAFDDLTTARRWWETTQHHIIHSSDMAFRFTHLDLPDDLVAECSSRVQKHLHRIDGHMAGDFPAPPSPSFHDLEQHLSRWLGAFQPLWDASVQGTETDYDDFIKAAHLRVQYLGMYTCVLAPLSCDHATIARLTPTFRELVQLSALVLHHQGDASPPVGGGAEVFTMDASPSWPLFLAGMRCRDFEVREQAVRLLARHPRRDGLWDSRMFHALTTRNRAVEVWNARQGTREEQWWRLQARTAYVDEEGVLKARALTQNPITGEWEDGEDEVGVFMHMN